MGLLLFAAVSLLAFSAPAEAAKCTKKGTNGDDILKGSKRKKDILCGKGGNDVLLGRGGSDQLLGGDGDDVLDGGTGSDKLKGQDGIDTATYGEATAAVVVNTGVGTATGAGSDKLSSVENATGSPLNDTLIGGDGVNLLSGGEGNDNLAGGLGDDTLAGDGGTDTANYFSAVAPMVIDLAEGTATGQGNDSVLSIENVTGSPQDDSLAGDPEPNALHGGAGIDTVSFVSAAAGVTVDLAADTASGDGADSIPAIENVVGSANDDTLGGDAMANSLAGGDGSDTVSYAGANAPVTLDLVGGNAVVGPGTAGEVTDPLSGIENAIGSPHADGLIGDDQDNALAGGDSDDVLVGGLGADELLGEDGGDQIYGEADDDELAGGAGNDLLDGGTGSDDCDGGTGINQLVGGCDVAPPQLTGFEITPAQVDTSGAAQQMTFDIDATDAVTGLDPAASEVAIFSPSGAPRGSAPLEQVSGDPNSGAFQAEITLPRYAANGTWTVAVTLADESGNTQTWSGTELEDLTFPSGFDQVGAGDAAAPTLGGFDVNPVEIDTSASSQEVAFTVVANDTLAGVDPAKSKIEVFSPAGAPRGTAPLTLTSGTPLDGNYEATVTVPRLAPQGDWTVQLTLVDTAGNDRTFTSANLVTAGFPGGFEQTAPGDETAPDLSGFSFSPTQIDTSLAPATMTFDLDVVDDQSGLSTADSVVTAIAPDGQRLDAEPFELVSGDPENGTYQTTITIPTGSVPGTWTVNVELFDQAGNERQWSSQDLIDDGFPGVFTNIGPDPT